MRDNEVTLLSLIGLPRSGTTIASEYFGAQNEYFHIGEFQSLTTRSIRKKGKCQCGNEIINCPFWSRVLNKISPEDLELLYELRRRLTVVALASYFNLDGRRTKQYKSVLLRIFKIIGEETPGKIIIDSSKNPLWHLMLHDALPSNALVKWNRDANELISSLESKGPEVNPLYLIAYKVLRVFVSWRFDTKISCDYDRFTEQPGRVLKRVDDLFNLENTEIKRNYSDAFFYRAQGHSIAGNPSRKKFGKVTIVPVSHPRPKQFLNRLLALILNRID